MTYQWCSYKFTIVFILVLQAISSLQQDQVCTLPDGGQSTCMRTHHCDRIWNELKSYGANPPAEVIEYANKHKCGDNKNFVCCPPYKRSKVQSTTPAKIQFKETVEENQVCNLPDGKYQSTCIRIHRCKHLSKLLKELTPVEIKEDLKQYACGPNDKYMCCPDKEMRQKINEPVSDQEDNSVILNVQPVEPKKTDLASIKNHKNIDLINSPHCGPSGAVRIINGNKTALREFPWAVLLGYTDEDGNVHWNCGGNLISDRYVITAAHCIKKNLKVVRLGEHTISTTRDCDDFGSCDTVEHVRVDKAIEHPQFSMNHKMNDIALIKLAEPVKMTHNIRTICLPTTEKTDFENLPHNFKANLTIYGWGKTEHNKGSDELLKASVPFVDNKECAKIFESQLHITVRSTYLCAGGIDRTDTCKGDSGSGIITIALSNRVPKYFLYGVVSGGVDCDKVDRKFFPGIYTNIAYYLDWILDNMS